METTTCNVENTFQEFQVKWGLDQNLIYCYNTNITINKRIHECPSEPFRLKNTSDFEVGRFIHYGDYWPLFKSVNYIWSSMANEFLNHIVNKTDFDLEDYYREVDKIRPPSVPLYEQDTHFNWIILGISITILILIIVYILLRVYFIRRRTDDFSSLRDEIAFQAAANLAEAVRTTARQASSDTSV